MPGWDINFNPKIDTGDSELFELSVRAECYRLSASGIPLPPRAQKKIRTLNKIRQIRGTTGIEGNTLEEDEIEKILQKTRGLSGKKGVSVEEQEIINANDVYEFIKTDVKDNPEAIIKEDLIRWLHYLTTKNCNYDGNVPGQYRSVTVTAGDYISPEPGQIEILMNIFFRLINSRHVVSQLTPIIRAILAHFYLISIHPFRDGNGRVSRGLEAYILYHGGFNVRGFYSLSNFYYKNRAEYIQKLQDARFRHDGDLNDFVRFCIRGYVKELEFMQNELLIFFKLLAFNDYYQELYLHGKEINKRQHTLLEYLTALDLTKPGKIVELPSMSVKDYKRKNNLLVNAVYSDLTTKTLLRDLSSLSGLGLIKIVNERIIANIDLMDETEL